MRLSAAFVWTWKKTRLIAAYPGYVRTSCGGTLHDFHFRADRAIRVAMSEDAFVRRKAEDEPGRVHPRKLGWLSTSALAMGGSNQSLFLIGALLIGQGKIPGQGTAAIALLILGLALAWAALPGWTELVLMWPNRVGGIAATCGEAFRPYAPVLGNLTGVSYWWGWVPTCGLTALLTASAIPTRYLTRVPVP